ncbi:hypothetical protein VNO80_15296 [Phaseolus coccineus]|uniref:Uncharacterized protein n=1 Tax=Phaseolus coccineus TaxID=3886 RepID=A0AAN9QZ65_PHACN
MPMPTLTDDSSLHKIQNLKNLNGVLLKETAQCRHQIDSLQSDLHRSAVTYHDNLAAFLIENAVTSAFVHNQVKEMNICFDTLLREKDGEVEGLNRELKGLAARLQNETSALAKERDGLVYETKRLKESVDREGKLRGEAEKIRLEGERLLLQKERDIAELKTERDTALKSSAELKTERDSALKSSAQLKTERDSALRSSADLKTERDSALKSYQLSLAAVETLKTERDTALKSSAELKTERDSALKSYAELKTERDSALKSSAELKTERDSALKSSQLSLAAIEALKKDIEVVTREKDEFVKLCKNHEQKIGGLEEELTRVNESWKVQEECMRVQFVNVDDKLGLATQRVDEMARKISSLLEEKKDIEKIVERLTEDNDGVRKNLNVTLKELEDKQHEVDEAARLKGEIEKAKADLESEIVELREKINELKESCMAFEEENKQLLSQVKSYRSAVEEGRIEKENLKKVFDEEKNKVGKLELLIAELQEMGVKRDADLGQVRSDRDKMVENERKLEGNVSDLRKENDELQSKLLEAKKEVEDLSAKVKVWCNNWNKALSLLKKTATLVSEQEVREEEVVWYENNVEEMEEIAVGEVERIKKAFESKEEMLDEMKQKVVWLNKSVAGAHKSKNMWTVISSATTIFAAALAAYLARGR